MQRLKGRTALITGASRGIGRAVAERFAAEGANVAINYASSEDAAKEVADIAAGHGVEARIYQADVGQEADCERLASEVIRDFGQLDTLINNAGLGATSIDRPHIVDASNEQWQRLLSVNFWGPVWLCRALVPHMRAAPRSDVIMMSTIATELLAPSFGVYAVSKAALEAMAHTLAREERKHGMRVNIIAPGLVDTDMGREVLDATGLGKDTSEANAKSPFGFICTPDDIAASILHLCSDDGRYITNQRIKIAGD
ncbi:MAG: SDR family oxidoreductase [Pseudomonadota bacterium]